jgi:hypothetical protein
MTDPEQPRCRYCQRLMSWREHDEQNRECNDCWSGPPVSLTEWSATLDDTQRTHLPAVLRNRMH